MGLTARQMEKISVCGAVFGERYEYIGKCMFIRRCVQI